VRPLGQLCSWSLAQGARKKQIYMDLIERANLNYSQGIHFTADLEQQEAKALNLTAPNFVIPLGLSLPAIVPNARQKLREKLNKPDREPIILFLSRIHEKKGLDYLIPALGQLRDRAFTFILAGSGASEYQQEVEKMLVKYGIRDRTHIAGFVAGEEKNLLLQGSDLFALTSHSENFGIAVLEALAAGLPALLTPGVALSEVVAKHQLGYVAEMDIQAVSQTLEQFLIARSFEDRDKLSLHIRQFIQDNYTWDKIVLDLIPIYKNLLN
jgi:glycosyltransferase involved in cell wall biosynthesis